MRPWMLSITLRIRTSPAMLTRWLTRSRNWSRGYLDAGQSARMVDGLMSAAYRSCTCALACLPDFLVAGTAQSVDVISPCAITSLESLIQSSQVVRPTDAAPYAAVTSATPIRQMPPILSSPTRSLDKLTSTRSLPSPGLAIRWPDTTQLRFRRMPLRPYRIMMPRTHRSTANGAWHHAQASHQPRRLSGSPDPPTGPSLANSVQAQPSVAQGSVPGVILSLDVRAQVPGPDSCVQRSCRAGISRRRTNQLAAEATVQGNSHVPR